MREGRQVPRRRDDGHQNPLGRSRSLAILCWLPGSGGAYFFFASHVSCARVAFLGVREMQKILIAIAIAIAAAYAGMSASSAAKSTNGLMTGMMGGILFPPRTTMMGSNKTQQ
jgi:hypothetical protein